MQTAKDMENGKAKQKTALCWHNTCLLTEGKDADTGEQTTSILASAGSIPSLAELTDSPEDISTYSP